MRKEEFTEGGITDSWVSLFLILWPSSLRMCEDVSVCIRYKRETVCVCALKEMPAPPPLHVYIFFSPFFSVFFYFSPRIFKDPQYTLILHRSI